MLGRVFVWLSFGLILPVAPIVIAILVIAAYKGSVSLVDVAGRGELALASVGVLTAAIVQSGPNRGGADARGRQTLFNLSIFSLLVVAGFYGVQTLPNVITHHDIVASISLGLLGLAGVMGVLLISAEGEE